MNGLYKNCCGCSACAAVCPKNCITMQKDAQGFYRPVLNTTLCTNCGLCKMICPQNKVVCGSSKHIEAYGAVSKDIGIKMASSSGGMFTLLAGSVLKKGGVVFGAAFNGKLQVVHKKAENMDELGFFRGSKYVQSYMGDCFSKAKKLLDDGKWVYFSGTPCQIAGLKSFLKKDYANLITQDLICHSAPSPLVWDEYLKFREKKAGSKVINVSFRYKEKDVDGYKLRMEFENGRVYAQDGNDLYMKAFINGLSAQKTCYDCKYKGLNRVSDITLADFWGVESLFPEIDKKNGVSLVLLHTEKGKVLFDGVTDMTEVFKTDPILAVKKNDMALRSVTMHPKRNKFFKIIKQSGFEKAYNKATSLSLKTKIKIKLRKLFK